MRSFLISLLVFAFAANAAPSKPLDTKEQFIGKQVGKLRFVLRDTDPVESEPPISGEVTVYRPTGEVLQKFFVDIGIAEPGFDFLDANDDGYVDMLLYDACAGSCAGAFSAADVFLYAPKLGRFVQSRTLSGRGDISKPKRKGCVKVLYKSNPDQYTNEDWCFNLKSGRWKLVEKSVDKPEPEME